jgi:uncharacterized integral membrane protein
MIAAYPWHYWLGLVLLLAAVLATLQVVVGYLVKVTATRYPNRRQRKAQAQSQTQSKAQ